MTEWQSFLPLLPEMAPLPVLHPRKSLISRGPAPVETWHGICGYRDEMTNSADRNARPMIAAAPSSRAASRNVMPVIHLRRHLYLIVAVKLALLGAIWWCFVRDARVPVDPDGTATHMLSKPQEPSK